MLNAVTIELFYKQVDELGLKFPVAAIAKATGFSKGTVSDILTRKKEPSENFLKLFSEKFAKRSEDKPDIATLMQTQNVLIQQLAGFAQTQNKILGELKEGIQDKVFKIDANLNEALVGVDTLQLEVKSAREVILKSLARIEKPRADEQFLLKEANNIMRNMRGSVDKKGK